ncbi:MAG: hypothetical protein M3O50_00700 [Myxococcota bacterium]|nr:hypothetical protein [Myxococcota bacterium]
MRPRLIPAVKLLIDARTTRGPWSIRVTNEGDLPVRLDADARLLSLEISPRGARNPVLCELPADMRPIDDSERNLLLPPMRSYTETFEPRLYCFGDRLQALAPGAIVVGRLGWVRSGRDSNDGIRGRSPYVIAALDGIEPEVSGVSMIKSLPIAVPDEPTPAQTGPAPADDSAEGDGTPRLTLRGASVIDAARPNEITIPITLRNDGTRPVVLRFRPEALGFDVMGGATVEHCVWPGLHAAPMRELFTALAPSESASLTLVLEGYCHGHAFDQPGLVVVRPWLDTRAASGAALGLHTFDGQVIATTPTLVRLHRGAIARPNTRPVLDANP